MKVKCYQKKNNYFIYETFYTNLIVTTKQKPRAEIQNIKKEKENPTTKIADGNTRENKHRRHRAIRKQKLEWLW